MPKTYFADTLEARVRAKKSCLMLGLDPNLERLPTPLPKDAEGVRAFCFALLDATQDLICGVKIQMAYFEALGSAGIKIVEELLIECKKRDLISMIDGKRNDIGATAAAYAKAYLAPGSPLESDCCTVNPLLGSDGVMPFVEHCAAHGKGIFVLVRTSNPSAKEVQNVGDLSVKLAELVEDWNITTQSPKTQMSAVGAVIGATNSEMLRFFRKEMPHAWILTPGVGAQGASVAEAMKAADRAGMGVLIPVARSVIFASSEADYAAAAQAKMAEYFEAQKPFVTGEKMAECADDCGCC